MEKLYPVKYKGKFWKEDEVDDIFKSFYHTKDSLDWQISVYVSEDMRICPDGEWI